MPHHVRFPMPKSSRKSTTTYDQAWKSLRIFDPLDLRTGEDIERAVNILQDSLDDRSIASIIQVSLHHTNNYGLGFMLSSISDTHVTCISTFLLNKFPTDIEAFYESITYHVILRLSHTFQNLPFTSGEKSDDLDGHLKHEEMALVALNELRKLLQDGFYKRDIGTTKSKKILYAHNHPGPRNSPPTWKALFNASSLWDSGSLRHVSLLRRRYRRLWRRNGES